MRALRQMRFVVAAHLQGQSRNVVPPPGEYVANDSITADIAHCLTWILRKKPRAPKIADCMGLFSSLIKVKYRYILTQGKEAAMDGPGVPGSGRRTERGSVSHPGPCGRSPGPLRGGYCARRG